jgi:hypothetical protein
LAQKNRRIGKKNKIFCIKKFLGFSKWNSVEHLGHLKIGLLIILEIELKKKHHVLYTGIFVYCFKKVLRNLLFLPLLKSIKAGDN